MIQQSKIETKLSDIEATVPGHATAIQTITETVRELEKSMENTTDNQHTKLPELSFLRCAVVGFSLLFSTVVFPLIYLLNILQFVLVVDTAAGADFYDKSTIFVYINFRRCSNLFSLTCFLFVKT